MSAQQPALSLDFVPRDGGAREPIDLVLLEQREWRPYAGIVTKANMVRYLARILYGVSIHAPVRGATPVAAPGLRHEYATIEVLGEQPCFGVLVVQGTATGFRHRFTLRFAKFDEDGTVQSIELESVPVSATWNDEEGEGQTASAEVEIPRCVRDLLETCADGRALFNLSVKRNEAEGRDVAYSTCTGKMLAMRPRYKNA